MCGGDVPLWVPFQLAHEVHHKWSGNLYISWKNKDKKLHDVKNEYTTITENIVVSLLEFATKAVCGGTPAPGPR